MISAYQNLKIKKEHIWLQAVTHGINSDKLV